MALAGVFTVYKLLNPEVVNIFPRCPVNQFTGLQCTGCGSQRAVHYLLNLDVASAFRMNPMVVLFIPYIMVGMVYDIVDKPGPVALKWRNTLFGQRAIFVILFLVIAFTIVRNLV